MNRSWLGILVVMCTSPAFAGVCERDSDELDSPHVVTYDAAATKQAVDSTFSLPINPGPEFIMAAVPFTEFGHHKSTDGEVKTWALHYPIPRNASNTSTLNTYFGGGYGGTWQLSVITHHVRGANCSDIEIAGQTSPKHKIRIRESREFLGIGTNAREGRSAFLSQRSLALELHFQQNQTRLTVTYNIDLKAEDPRWVEPAPNINCGSQGEGKVASDSDCRDYVSLDFRDSITPQKHLETPTDLFKTLDALIDLIYIEPLN